MPDVASGHARIGTGVFSVDHSLLRTAGETRQPGFVEVDSEGFCHIAVLNNSDHRVTIPAGKRAGVVTRAEEIQDDATIAALCALKDRSQARARKATPTTKAEKKQAYFQQVADKAGREKTQGGGDLPKDLQGFDPASCSRAQKRRWLDWKFQLASKPCLQSTEDREAAIDVLEEFWDLFSHDGSYGHTHLLQHRIITEEVHPIKCKYRPIPPVLEPALRDQIEEWLKHDVIEPANSPWSFNLVAAKKKGGKIRWCVDWRRLNDVTKKDTWPMPAIHDTIGKLAGSRIFSGVDMAGAFHCIDIAPQDREKTAFATPFGSFQQKRLGFGVTNGPATYCRLVDLVLKNIPPSMAISFLDDGVVHSADLRDHIRNLRVVLQAYRDAGLRLAPHKCSFFAEEIDYLGHTINASGIRPTATYLDAVRKWPMPKFRAEVRSFVGFINYYRQHIPRFAIIAKPWTEVMAKTSKEEEKAPLKVTQEMKQSFGQLKEALTTAPVLGFPYFHGRKAGEFTLDTDYCKDQIGAVLSQDQDGREVVIQYGSKKLSGYQRNWPSTKGELYAGIFWMERWAYYLKYRYFRWRTDNIALKQVHSIQCPSAIILRWAQRPGGLRLLRRAQGGHATRQRGRPQQISTPRAGR